MAMDVEPVTSARNAASNSNARRAEPGAYRPGYEVVAEQILQLIAEMSPGDRMPTEKELAARLGSSRTVVREAVKILSAAGRVSAQRGRGLFVADGEGMLGETRFARFFMPTNLDHIFMLFEFRRSQPAALPLPRPARPNCASSKLRRRPAGTVTRPATRRSSRPATTISTSALPRRHTTSSSSPRCAKHADCSGRPA